MHGRLTSCCEETISITHFGVATNLLLGIVAILLVEQWHLEKIKVCCHAGLETTTVDEDN